MNAIRNTASVALGLLFAGCMYPGRATREQRLATAAQESARYCDGDTETTTQEVIAAVHEAQPLFAKINTGKRSTATKSYLLGAKLLIESRQGMTAQSMERTLRCHQARRVMVPSRSPTAGSTSRSSPTTPVSSCCSAARHPRRAK